RIVQSPVLGVDEWFNLLHQHAFITLCATSSLFPITDRRVLCDTLLAGMIDAYDDQRFDVLAVDQSIGSLGHMPSHPWHIRGAAIKEILPVLQVEYRISRLLPLFVTRR